MSEATVRARGRTTQHCHDTPPPGAVRVASARARTIDHRAALSHSHFTATAANIFAKHRSAFHPVHLLKRSGPGRQLSYLIKASLSPLRLVLLLLMMMVIGSRRGGPMFSHPNSLWRRTCYILRYNYWVVFWTNAVWGALRNVHTTASEASVKLYNFTKNA